MNLIRRALTVAALAATFTGGLAFAQDHHDNNSYVHHDEWKKGAHINKDDWGRGDQGDYKQHHLKSPPRGYEWRQVDGNYVMAAAATGVIASVIAASAAH